MSCSYSEFIDLCEKNNKNILKKLYPTQEMSSLEDIQHRIQGENIDEKLVNDIKKFLYNKSSDENSRDIFFELPQEIPFDVIGCNIMVLGLNPSSEDVDSKIKEKIKDSKCDFPSKYDDLKKCKCIFQHLHNKTPGLTDKVAEKMAKYHYMYDKYFKRNFELFSDIKEIEPTLIWRNKEYFDKYIKPMKFEDSSVTQFVESLSKENDIFVHTGENNNRKKMYILFSDLVFIKNTSAKRIEDIIENLKEEVTRLFELQIDYYKPQLVVVTNAAASNFLYKIFEEDTDGYTKSIIYYSKSNAKGILEKIPIVLSSMVTGQRQLDNYNYLRLKKEIEECIRVNIMKKMPISKKVIRFSKLRRYNT